MRRFFLAIILIVSFVGNTQEVIHIQRPQHSFQFSGGAYIDM